MSCQHAHRESPFAKETILCQILGLCVADLSPCLVAVRRVCKTWDAAVTSPACWEKAFLDIANVCMTALPNIRRLAVAWRRVEAFEVDMNSSRTVRVELARIRAAITGMHRRAGQWMFVPEGRKSLPLQYIRLLDGRTLGLSTSDGAAVGLRRLQHSENGRSYSVRILREPNNRIDLLHGPSQAYGFGFVGASPRLLHTKLKDWHWLNVPYAMMLMYRTENSFLDATNIFFDATNNTDNLAWDSLKCKIYCRDFVDDAALQEAARAFCVNGRWVFLPKPGDIVSVTLREVTLRTTKWTLFGVAVNGVELGFKKCRLFHMEDVYPMIVANAWSDDAPCVELVA